MVVRFLAVPLLLAPLAACAPEEPPASRRVLGGDPARGQAALTQYGCPACHTIPRVWAADGVVGPPLTGFGKRAYIAGSLPNEPDTLVRWIRNAPALRPETAMPDMGVSQADATDIAAFLYTLR